MKKAIILSILFFLLQKALLAQTINPVLLSTAGTVTISLPSVGAEISYSIGEVAMASNGNCNMGIPIITNGFQQPDSFVTCNLDTLTALNKKYINSQELSIYPNPSHGIFNLKFTGAAIETIRIRVYNITGKIISTISAGAENNELNLTGQPQGIYFVHIIYGGSDFVQKIIIQ